MALNSIHDGRTNTQSNAECGMLEMERAVIGAMLIEPRCVALVLSILRQEYFMSGTIAKIYSLISKMFGEGKAVDLVTVGQEVIAHKIMDLTELISYTQKVGSASHIEQWARMIKEKYVVRRYQEAGMKITAIASDEARDMSDVVRDANKLLQDVNEVSQGGKTAQSIATLADKSLKELEERYRRQREGLAPGISTGLTDLDKMTSGLRGGQLVVIAGRPGTGKTAMTIHLALSAARAGVPVCMYQLEMSDVSITDRFIISMSGVCPQRYREGRVTADDWKLLNAASSELSKLPIYIDDNPSADMHYVRTHSMLMSRKGQCGMIIVDYLQLAVGGDVRQREQEVAAASRMAKLVAKELNVPFILLAQLNRQAEARTDKRPKVSDLRESGSIEQDADMVLLLYRPALYGFEEMDGQPTKGLGVIIVGKQRDGANGDVCFGHNSSLTKIYDYHRGGSNQQQQYNNQSLNVPF